MSQTETFVSLVSRADEVDCNVNIGGTGLAVIWVMVTLALSVVVTRLYTQIRVTKQYGLSDWLMMASISILIGFASLISVQYHFGWGRHQACVEAQDLQMLETQIKFNVTGQSFGIMGSTFGRLSFIVFMLALFGSKNWVRWTLWSLFVAQVITNLGSAIVIYVQCKDPRALYDFTLPSDLCWPAYVQTYLGWGHTAFNGACDAFLSILPIIMIWNLHMATRIKVGLALLLSMSALALVGLIMKCVYLKALSNTGDYSYNTVPMFTWIVVEGTLVDIAASIPLLRPLFKHTFPMRSTNANSYDLPRYASRSGQSDSTGFSKLGSKARTRTSVNGGIPRYPGMTSLEGGSSEEDMVLILQQQQSQQQQPSSPQKQLQRRGSQGWPHADDKGPARGIVVRQEYTVTSEVNKEKSWGEKVSDEIVGVAAGVVEDPTQQHGHIGSVQSSEGSLPTFPASAWRRDRL